MKTYMIAVEHYRGETNEDLFTLQVTDNLDINYVIKKVRGYYDNRYGQGEGAFEVTAELLY